jgi:hypothetical protein
VGPPARHFHPDHLTGKSILELLNKGSPPGDPKVLGKEERGDLSP